MGDGLSQWLSLGHDLAIPWIFYKDVVHLSDSVHVLDINMKVCLTSIFLVFKTARACNHGCMLKMILKEGNFQKKISHGGKWRRGWPLVTILAENMLKLIDLQFVNFYPGGDISQPN